MTTANGGIKGSTLPIANSINANTDHLYGLGNNGHTTVQFPTQLFKLANNISFNPGTSGLTSNNVQDAILELKALINALSV